MAIFKGIMLFKSLIDPKKNLAYKTTLSISALLILASATVLASRFSGQISFPEINSMTSFEMIFAVGLIAGLHCIGMCGGFIVGYTAREAAQGNSLLSPHLMYGAGKTLSYAMFGALFGMFARILSSAMTRRFVQASGIILIVMGTIMLNKGALQIRNGGNSGDSQQNCPCLK